MCDENVLDFLSAQLLPVIDMLVTLLRSPEDILKSLILPELEDND